MEEQSNKASSSPPSVHRVLEALKKDSRDLQTHPRPDPENPDSAAVKALLELEHETVLAKDPNLAALTRHLSALKTLLHHHRAAAGFGLRRFLSRRAAAHSISLAAASVHGEIQAWIDRDTVETLTAGDGDAAELVRQLGRFENRVEEGFNRELQDLVLKSNLFSSLESILCNPKSPPRVREDAAYLVAALIRFNKDVFVGQVLMGRSVHFLIELGSRNSIQVLCSLIKSIKSPLVDGIESNGEIPRIMSFLTHPDLEMRGMAMECVLEIGYFGRREAIEAMVGGGLVEKLVELQRSEVGGDHRFESCVARFAVQIEVGEGLREGERRGFKQEVIRRVREVSGSEAEASTIVAEVLWGSSP